MPHALHKERQEEHRAQSPGALSKWQSLTGTYPSYLPIMTLSCPRCQTTGTDDWNDPEAPFKYLFERYEDNASWIRCSKCGYAGKRQEFGEETY